jgi:peptide/nickel transport system substrate-binding protein
MMSCKPTRLLTLVLAGLFLYLAPVVGAQQPKQGGTLRVAFEADVTGFDPHLVPGLQNYYVNQNLYNTLVSIDENLEFVPDLAKSWDMQDGGQVYVFHLYKGVKFHDGTECDAAAVKWNLDRAINEPKSAQGKFLQHVDSVAVVDAHTLKVTMKYPSSTLLESLAFNGAGVMIISPAAAQKYGDDLPRHPVGTGPFKLVKWEQNRIIELERNREYFKPGLPYLDRIEYRIMKDGVTRATALRAGEVDFVNWLPREHVERIGRDAQLRVLRGPEASNVFINFVVSRPPWDDVRLRQALGGYGIDRAAIAKAAFLSYATPTVSYVSPGARGYVDLNEMYPYNPERAKALLRDAGYDGKKPLQYTIMTHNADPVLATIATMMKTQLANIGVEVTIEVLDRPVFLKRVLRDKDYDQTINIALPFASAYDRAWVLERGSLNIPNHDDPKVDALFEKYRRAIDLQTQLKVAEEIQRYLAEQMIYMTVTGYPIIQAGRDRVKGYSYLRGIKVLFETTWLER